MVAIFDGVIKLNIKKVDDKPGQLIFIQTEGCSDEELRFQQKLLNEKYDAYVRKYGPITGRGSKQAFQDDATYYQSRVKDERHYAYYCRSAYLIDERKCEKNYIREEQITAFVLEQLRNVLKEQQVKAKDLTKLNMEEYECKIAEYELEEKKIAEECEYMKKQAGIIYGQYKEGVITRAEYDAFKQNKKRTGLFRRKKIKGN